MTEKEIVKISKFISLVLRHKPEILNLNMDEEGWVNVGDLIAKINNTSFPLTKDVLDEIVVTNDKKRFAYSEDGKYIRASQGHSIDVDLKLESKSPPNYLYHGTGEKFIDSIMENGIKKMNRQHVHLSSDFNTAIKVGSRHGKPHVLSIMANKMEEDGFKFFLSDNNVWLVNEIPSKYIERRSNERSKDSNEG